MAVRIHSGASRRHIVRLSVGAGLEPAIVGAAIGLPAAALTAHPIQSWLFGVQPIDAVTFAGVTVVLILASAATSWIPAQRATRIETDGGVEGGIDGRAFTVLSSSQSSFA